MSGLNQDLQLKGGPTIAVKKVDEAKLSYPNIDMSADDGGFRKVQGKRSANADTTGDVVKSAMDEIANPPAPRQQMRGQQNSRHYKENGKSFRSTEWATDSDAGN